MKNYKIEMKWTLLFALMAIVWHFLERLAGFHTTRIAYQQAINALIMVPALTLYILALRDKRRNFYEGTMTYRQGLWSGFVLSVFISLASVGYASFNLLVVSPDFFDNAIAYAVSHGLLSHADAVEQFNLANYILIGIFAGIFSGIGMTALVMIFLRSKRSYTAV